MVYFKINLMSIIIYSLSACYGCELEENINKYLFDTHQFKFVDLTLSVFKIRRLPQQNDLKSVELYEEEWIQTSVNLGSKSSVHPGVGLSISKIPLENLVVPLMIADVSGKVGGDSNFVLQKHHLDFFLNNYFGNTEQPCLLLFKFGWSNVSKNSTSSPGISVEVANWITTAYKNIVGVGVDLPSVDPGSSTNYEAHNALVGAGVYVVENVNLEQHVPDAWCTSVLLPQSRPETRALARLIAICPKSRMVQRQDIPWHRL